MATQTPNKKRPKVDADINAAAIIARIRPTIAVEVVQRNGDDGATLHLDALDEFGGESTRFVSLRLSPDEARRIGEALLSLVGDARVPFARLPFQDFPVGARVCFGGNYSVALGNHEAVVPAGTTGHIVQSDANMITVVPHCFIAELSDCSENWRHEVQYRLEDLEETQVMPFCFIDRSKAVQP